MRTATVTLFSRTRLAHVRRQQSDLVAQADLRRVLVWLDTDAPPSSAEAPEFAGAIVLHVPPTPDGLRLAAGRNAGAASALDAGADLLVFLDADCIAGPTLLERYRSAAAQETGALLSGPVTYLPEGFDTRGGDLEAATRPHPARPSPPDGALVTAGPDDYALFWSLSFAVTAATWHRLGGFAEAYVGYGGEDTDFAFSARAARVPLVWVGGAHAYHQYHPTSSPPWQHLDDILRNGAIFAGRWGVWPMGGWLDAFATAGAIRSTSTGWERIGDARPSEAG